MDSEAFPIWKHLLHCCVLWTLIMNLEAFSMYKTSYKTNQFLNTLCLPTMKGTWSIGVWLVLKLVDEFVAGLYCWSACRLCQAQNRDNLRRMDTRLESRVYIPYERSRACYTSDWSPRFWQVWQRWFRRPDMFACLGAKIWDPVSPTLRSQGREIHICKAPNAVSIRVESRTCLVYSTAIILFRHGFVAFVMVFNSIQVLDV